MLGIFDSLFDFNGDGKLDFLEESMKWASIGMAIDHVTEPEEKETSTGGVFAGSMNTENSSDASNSYADAGHDDYLRGELEMAGIDADEFEWMDEDERRDVLEDAGLDPWDYDIF